ncbi:hypothetical protein QJS04_geneDACA013155 [Acorus gramineus]|uniref:Uncharacterized protein n=1 Tax=Acorus gramineus TaxID=55184 RepID=A0AAV9B7K8_ACOGR|nr:hypothetical protein QJS04_geneDACA013155 [Acorus gramineus]
MQSVTDEVNRLCSPQISPPASEEPRHLILEVLVMEMLSTKYHHIPRQPK